MSTTTKVTCPHCNATLTIDTEAGVVVAHEAPVQHTDKVDFDTRMKQMKAEKERASDRLAEAMRKEKDKDRIMADKFRELMSKAKDDDGTAPVRDIDLD
jgi:glutaredoxin